MSYNSQVQQALLGRFRTRWHAHFDQPWAMCCGTCTFVGLAAIRGSSASIGEIKIGSYGVEFRAIETTIFRPYSQLRLGGRGGPVLLDDGQSRGASR